MRVLKYNCNGFFLFSFNFQLAKKASPTKRAFRSTNHQSNCYSIENFGQRKFDKHTIVFHAVFCIAVNSLDFQVSCHKVHQYFSKIGKIQIASFIPDGFAFIRFIDDAVGMQVLAKYEANRLEIDNRSVQIKRGDFNNLPYGMLECIRESIETPMAPFEIDQLLLQPEIEKSPKNILNALNDHCLCEILGRLSLLDLLRVSKACKRLGQIATKVFELKYKNKRINLDDLVENGEAMTNIEYLLKKFGSSISSIGINEDIGNGNNIFGLIDKHCKNMKSLLIDGVWMRSVNVKNYSQLYGRLESLIVIGGFLGVNSVLHSCNQLKEFQAMMIDCLDLTHISLPCLVDLNLRFFKCRGMGEFLIRHPNMEMLKMDMPDPIVTNSLSNNVEKFIFDHLPNIREMEMFEISDQKITKLSEMRNLKSVYLDFENKPVAQVIKQLSAKKTPIETLELANGFIDDKAIGYICEIETITKICFFKCIGFDEFFLIRLLQSLPNLKSICDSSGSMLILDNILPILKSKRVKWLNEVSDDSFVSYVRAEFLLFNIISNRV